MNVINIGEQFDASHEYFQLGLLKEAHAALDVLEEVPEISVHLSGCRMALLAYQGRWHDAGICATNLCVLEPHEPDHFLASAEIQRHLGLVRSAIDVLLDGPPELFTMPAYHFQLARYHALLGELDEARGNLLRALDLDDSVREGAKGEPALKPVLESLPPPLPQSRSETFGPSFLDPFPNPFPDSGPDPFPEPFPDPSSDSDCPF